MFKHPIKVVTPLRVIEILALLPCAAIVRMKGWRYIRQVGRQTDGSTDKQAAG